MIIDADSLNKIQFIGSTSRKLNFLLYDLNNNPLTGIDIATATFKLAKRGSTKSVLTKSLNDTISINSNVVTVELKPNDTKMLDGDYICQLRLIDTGGVPFSPDEKIINIIPYIRSADDEDGNSIINKSKTKIGFQSETDSQVWIYTTIADIIAQPVNVINNKTVSDALGTVI